VKKTPAKKYVPKLGDAVRVVWLDICEMSNADPEVVRPAVFKTDGFFVDRSRLMINKKFHRFIRISDTYDLVDGKFYGACAYPVGCIVSIEKRKDK
jgi:hypothetical protein